MVAGKVYSAVRRLCVFFVPYDGNEYRYVAGRVWKPEDSLTEEEYELCGSGLHADDIVFDIVEELFRESLGDLGGMEEICDGGPEPTITVDLDECRYTRRSIERALQILADKLTAGDPFYADDVQIRNRSGNDDYPDPVKSYCPFDVPADVRAALVLKSGKGGKCR